MPTFRHGKGIAVFVDQYAFSGYFKDIAYTNQVGVAETSNFLSTAKEFVVGLKSGNVTLTGMFEGTALVGTDQYFATVLGGSAKQKVIIALETKAARGSRAVMVNADTASYAVQAPVANIVSAVATLESSAGGVEHGVILSDTPVVTTTSVLTGVDDRGLVGTPSTNGGVGFLSVPVNTLNGTVVVKVQHSTDNSTFVDLITFTTVVATTTTSERIEVASGTTVNRYLRVSYAVAGTTGSATPVVAFSRR